MALTRRQRQVLDFVTGFIETKGYSPTLQEIGAAFGLSSVATVHKHVTSLVAKGYLRRGFNQNRSLDVAPRPGTAGASELPLLGRVAAGAPIEAIEERETIAVPDYLVGRLPSFVLQVRGSSMIEEQIRDGDYIVVEERDTVDDGEMVVALVGAEEATLKKLYREGENVRLQPANPEVEPIVVPGSQVQVRGVVVGLIRRCGVR